MAHKGWLGFLTVLAIAIGVLLLADVVYFWHGSLELFPSDEQQNQVHLATGVLAILLFLAEGGILLALRHCKATRAR